MPRWWTVICLLLGAEAVSVAKLRAQLAKKNAAAAAGPKKKAGGGAAAPKGPPMPPCEPGMVCSPEGEVFKPEECGVDGDGNGWCSGKAVPAEWFMKPEKPEPKKAAAKPAVNLKSAKKKSDKKDKKKDSGGGGRIMAVKQLAKKGDSQKPSTPKKTTTSSPIPSAEPVPKSGSNDPWIAIIVIILTIPLGYYLWKKYKEEMANKEKEKEVEAAEKKAEENKTEEDHLYQNTLPRAKEDENSKE